MGFELTQDIFGPGATEKRWFTHFPVQVALLFRPEDHEFSEAVRRSFKDLSDSTGRDVVFFTPLNPPRSWAPRGRSDGAGDTYTDPSLSLDEPVLVYELARRFEVAWDVLPVLIASTNLWSGSFVVAATDASRFQDQLHELTKFARRKQGRGVPDLLDLLKPQARDDYAELRPGVAVAEVDPWDSRIEDGLDLGSRRVHLAQVLLRQISDAKDGVDRTLDQLRGAREAFEQVRRHLGTQSSGDGGTVAELQRLASQASPVMTELRNAQLASESMLGPLQRALAQYQAIVADDAAKADRWRHWLEVPPLKWLNRLLGPSARTTLLFRGAIDAPVPGQIPPAWSSQGFDDEGMVMLTSAAMTERALRHLQSTAAHAVDFSAALLGIYKAVERQVNLSLIQAARKARGVPMPAYFGRWHPDSPRTRCVVDTGIDGTGQAHLVDINQRRLDKPDAHRFLGLGTCLHVVRTLIGDPAGDLSTELAVVLGRETPADVVTRLNRVRQARNRSVHEGVLTVDQYEQLSAQALSTDVVAPLRMVKEAVLAPASRQ